MKSIKLNPERFMFSSDSVRWIKGRTGVFTCRCSGWWSVAAPTWLRSCCCGRRRAAWSWTRDCWVVRCVWSCWRSRSPSSADTLTAKVVLKVAGTKKRRRESTAARSAGIASLPGLCSGGTTCWLRWWGVYGSEQGLLGTQDSLSQTMSDIRLFYL